jgi:hypothetical protein
MILQYESVLETLKKHRIEGTVDNHADPFSLMCSEDLEMVQYTYADHLDERTPFHRNRPCIQRRRTDGKYVIRLVRSMDLIEDIKVSVPFHLEVGREPTPHNKLIMSAIISQLVEIVLDIEEIPKEGINLEIDCATICQRHRINPVSSINTSIVEYAGMYYTQIREMRAVAKKREGLII